MFFVVVVVIVCFFKKKRYWRNTMEKNCGDEHYACVCVYDVHNLMCVSVYSFHSSASTPSIRSCSKVVVYSIRALTDFWIYCDEWKSSKISKNHNKQQLCPRRNPQKTPTTTNVGKTVFKAYTSSCLNFSLSLLICRLYDCRIFDDWWSDFLFGVNGGCWVTGSVDDTEKIAIKLIFITQCGFLAWY